jgi:hypothetical protein
MLIKPSPVSDDGSLGEANAAEGWFGRKDDIMKIRTDG